MKQKKNNKKQQHRVKNIYEKIPMLKTLNPEQQQALEQINHFLKTDDNFYLLSGGAGTVQ